MIIAIDGESASGKGTIAKLLAKKIGFAYLDTGLLYRATAYYANKQGVLDNTKELVNIAKKLRLKDLDNSDLKTDQVAQLASKVSSLNEVRESLFDLQINFANNPNNFIEGNFKGAILDGRDIGNNICPKARLKFYIKASLEVRAKRRFKELKEYNPDVVYENILISLGNRDTNDKIRQFGKLQPADDAIVIDNTNLSIEDTLNIMYDYYLQAK